jgi:hypothetical protein
MVLREHLMYYSHDWDEIFPSWIKYVKKDKIIIGAKVDHIKLAHRIKSGPDKEEEIKKVEKYSHTEDLNDLEDLYDVPDEY